MSIRLLPVSPGFQAAQSCDLSPSFCSTGLIMWRGNIVGGGGDCCWNTALSMLLHRPEDITPMRPELWTFFNVTSTFYLLRNTCDCSSLRRYELSVVIHFITCFKCLFMSAIYFRRVWKASWKKIASFIQIHVGQFHSIYILHEISKMCLGSEADPAY